MDSLNNSILYWKVLSQKINHYSKPLLFSWFGDRTWCPETICPETMFPRQSALETMYALCWRQSALDKICSIDIMPRRLSTPERQSTQWDNMTRRQSAPEITCTETICPRDFMPPRQCALGDNMRSVSQSVFTILSHSFHWTGLVSKYLIGTQLCYVMLGWGGSFDP